MITIYALVDPRNGLVMYIGRTGNLKDRIAKHNSVGTNKGTPKNQFIRTLRKEGYRIDYFILDEVPKDEASFWERYYTDLYRSWGFELLNNLYYKFGNQTSFKLGEATKEVVAITREGKLHSEYKSIKQAKIALGNVGVSHSLLRLKKTAAGFIWFYKDEYDVMSQEAIDKVLKWANTSGLVRNSGSFKKGLIPWNKKIAA